MGESNYQRIVIILLFIYTCEDRGPLFFSVAMFLVFACSIAKKARHFTIFRQQELATVLIWYKRLTFAENQIANDGSRFRMLSLSEQIM